MMDRPAFHLHIDLTDLHVLTFREAVRQFTADHAADDTILINIVSCIVDRFDRRTVAYDRDLVCYIRKLIELMSINPGKRFGMNNEIKEGLPANLCVWKLDDKYVVNPDDFLSMGRATPFEGMEVYGKCVMTIVKGEIKWKQ